jgi:hypothetical protein
MKRPHNRILEKLGGGIGVAFKAEDTRLHCFAALTFLPDDVARDACRSLMGIAAQIPTTERAKHQDSSMRRLPGPAGCRLGEGSKLRRPNTNCSGLAENTNSIICDGSSEPEKANGCPVLHGQEPSAEWHNCASRHPIQINRALSGARPETSCFSLDFDLHGCHERLFAYMRRNMVVLAVATNTRPLYSRKQPRLS